MVHAVRVYTATPWAFLIVAGYAILWATFGKLDYSSMATLAVWTMTLFIQRAQHRDTQAIHAKLDELLRTQGEARNELTQLAGEYLAFWSAIPVSRLRLRASAES